MKREHLNTSFIGDKVTNVAPLQGNSLGAPPPHVPPPSSIFRCSESSPPRLAAGGTPDPLPGAQAAFESRDNWSKSVKKRHVNKKLRALLHTGRIFLFLLRNMVCR